MMIQRYILTMFMAVLAMTVAKAETNFKDETLNYRVEYKWGLVNKTAGNLTVKLRNRGDRYVCNLAGATAPWADHVFKVRDTLRCEVLKDGFKPVFYEKIAHEGKDDKHETVRYSYNGSLVTGNCTRVKSKGGKLDTDEQKVLTAEGYTLDMLSAFYYMRGLPYETMTKGEQRKTNIFSGKKKETLTIKYDGITTIDVKGTKYECYHIKFTFTSKGGKKSSDDIDAWITTTASRIPIKLEGSLPIGKIRCFYVP